MTGSNVSLGGGQYRDLIAMTVDEQKKSLELIVTYVADYFPLFSMVASASRQLHAT